MDDKQLYDSLKKTILKYSDQYYNQDESKISDYEYDQLMNQFKLLEAKHPEFITNDSPTQKVGGSVKREAGVLVKHRVAMLSLQDAFSKEEVYSFVEDVQSKVTNPVFVVEYKIDGLSLSLRYNHGKLDLAVTRGDGILQGEDVTANAKVIDDICHSINEPLDYLEVRGEVYMSNSSFNQVNKEQELKGKKIFANPRNCAAGTLRQLDTTVTKNRKLSMFVFNIQECIGKQFSSHSEGYVWLKQQGFKIIDNYQICNSASEVWSAIEKIDLIRSELDYELDGAVVKVDNYEHREILGQTAKAPKWAIAYKYPPEEKETKLLDIELSVGRTGRITPTAIFEPIRLCGTNVSRATLHNQDFIDDLDIRINDTIVVYKSGEIIPKVKKVIKEKRLDTSVPYTLPTKCPICNHDTGRTNDAVDIKCLNDHCSSKLLRNLVHFVSRDCFDIKGFGTAYIETLVEQGYIKDISDIFNLHLHRDALIENKVIGLIKSTDNLLDAIEKSKGNDATKLLISLGIPNIGKSGAKSLLKKFKSINAIIEASIEELIEVDDIGNISAEIIYDYFRDDVNIELLNKLKATGLNMELIEQFSSNKFENLIFVVTGSMEKTDRKEMILLIEQNGGKVSSSVSKKTNYVVAGDKAGSKLTKANDLGIQVLNEDEFIKFLEA